MNKLLQSLVVLLFLASPAATEEVAPGNWVSDCEEDFCVFRKTLTFVNSDSAFALFEILINTTSGNASLVLTAPLGVALQPGIQVIVEEQEWLAPLKVCYGDGCRATIEISNDDLALLLQKKTMEIRYIPFGKQNPLSAILPLNGLIAAISRTR